MEPRKNLVYCRSCNSKYDVSGVPQGRKFACKSCGIVVEIPKAAESGPFFKASGAAEILKPELDPGGADVAAFEFTKMAATENDYVLVDCMERALDRPSETAQVACNRRRGIGSDGLLLLLPSRAADVAMRMFNPDGSEAEMCGNGIRCLACCAFDRGYARKGEFRIETRAGIKNVRISSDRGIRTVRVDMGVPATGAPKGSTVRVETGGRAFDGVPVSVGNPHFVIFTEGVDSFDLAKWGPAIENHPRFPGRTNVEFVQVLNRSEVLQRTHERGVGETHGCGTGATAVCAAGLSLGITSASLRLHLKGGDLEVEIDESGRAFLTGPAVEVFSGSWPSRTAVRAKPPA